MKIQLVSDLHLERYPDFMPRPAEAVDVLVLAGDIGSYQPGSRLTDEDFGLGRFSPLAPESPWRRVLFVPGNHEYDGLDHAATDQRLQACCERLGILWLQRRALVLDGVRFVGATLWSDFDALALAQAPDAQAGRQALEVSMTRLLRERDKAFRAADFYLRKNTCLHDGQAMLASALRELALVDQDWLRQELVQTHPGSTVVVTHFAPSLRSADPRYGLTPGTAGFCNALDDLFRYADLWLHGHLHCPSDYVVSHGEHRCRVVANPRGYSSKGEQQTYRDGFCVDMDTPPARPG